MIECLDCKQAVMLLSNDVTLAHVTSAAFALGTDYSDDTLSTLLASLSLSLGWNGLQTQNKMFHSCRHQS